MDFPTTRGTQLADELGATFAQRGAKCDESDAFVAEKYADLEARKLIAAGVPEELGGGGATPADLAGIQGVRFHPLQGKPQTIMAGRHALGLSLDH